MRTAKKRTEDLVGRQLPLAHVLLLLFLVSHLSQHVLTVASAFAPVISTVRRRCRSGWHVPCLMTQGPQRIRVQACATTRADNNDDDCPTLGGAAITTRRMWLSKTTTTAIVSSGLSLLIGPQSAEAALVQFPCSKLKNRYHFMRAGESELERENIYSSNALFLTNRENSMTTDVGAESVLKACQALRDSGHLPTLTFHSLAANTMDTGDLMARELKLGRDRLLPEFTYLDQRGIGLWDSTQYDTTKKAIMALDYFEAGKEGMGGRPLPNDDGTPNETLADQFIRLRQFLSLQESRTSGENILVIFPDGTGPALLSAMIAGVPYNECHCLDFQPGEIRLDVTQENVLKLYQARKEDPTYLTMLEEGKQELEELRKETLGFVNRKEQIAEQKRTETEEAFLREKQRQRELERKKREELYLRQEEEKRIREERVRMKEQQRELQREEKQRKRKQTEGVYLNGDQSTVETSFGVLLSNLSRVKYPALFGVGLGLSVFGTASRPSADGKSPNPDENAQTSTKTPTGDHQNKTVTEAGNQSIIGETGSSTVAVSPKVEPSVRQRSVEEELEDLAAAEERFNVHLAKQEDLLSLASTVKTAKKENVLNVKQTGQSRRNFEDQIFDDGGEAWLRVLVEIRDQDDEDDYSS